MSNLESNQPNLENELLKGLRNQTVIGKIQNQVIKESKILPHIQILNAPGDVLKIIGLKSNRPKQFTWDYDSKKFGPGDTVTHKAEITDKDKLIFYTVFSEPIEKIAVGDKVSETVAKQAAQVSYDIADFYDEEFVEKFACDLERYHQKAMIKLNADQLRDIRLVGELAITTGYQMVSPTTLFNKREERCNVRNTKQILCFVDNSLYGRGQVASIYKSPSPTLEALERVFTVIPCNMVNNVKLALIDSGAIYLWSSLNQRYLKLDEYVATHKLLDHIWRKWIFVDYRPAFAVVFDEKATTNPILPTTPKKTILADYATLKDRANNPMNEASAKKWNEKGFDYAAAEKWLGAGLLMDDWKFANWLVKTKKNNHNDPDWLNTNVTKGDIKNLDTLRGQVS